MSDDFDEDDFEVEYQFIDAKPFSKYTIAHFCLSIVVGTLRSVTEAVCELGDALIGHEAFTEAKKDFEDSVRLDLEAIATDADDR